MDTKEPWESYTGMDDPRSDKKHPLLKASNLTTNRQQIKIHIELIRKYLSVSNGVQHD